MKKKQKKRISVILTFIHMLANLSPHHPFTTNKKEKGVLLPVEAGTKIQTLPQITRVCRCVSFQLPEEQRQR